MANQLTNPLGGRGTTGTVAKWSSPTTIGDSILTDSGTAISSSGPIRATGTSATAPAFTGSDTDTGVYFPAANQVRISTAGSLAIAVDASQNVGVGTAAPGDRLTIAGTAGTCVVSMVETGVRNWAIRSGGVATNVFDICDLTAASSRLAITSTGNVGLGTASPTDRMVVGAPAGTAAFGITIGETFGAGSGRARLALADSNRGIGLTAANDILTHTYSGQNILFGHGTTAAFTERMRIDGSGNVGIGTTSPTKKLDVNGAANITGALTVAGSVSRTSGSTAGVLNGAFIVVAVPEVAKAFLLSSTTTNNKQLSSLHLVGGDAATTGVTALYTFQTTVATSGAGSVRITNMSGVTATIEWSFLQIS